MGTKGIAIASVAITLLCILFPTLSSASPTPTPSPSHIKHSHATASPFSSVLTQAQKDVLSLADTNFALEAARAQAGFDRAVADAKAIRDQAITEAGNSKSAIRVAQQNFQDFKKTIANAYQSDLRASRMARQSALAAAHIPARTK